MRSTSVLTKVPTRLSVALCVRFATGTPIGMSVWPVRRCSRDANAASMVMKRVEPVSLAEPGQPVEQRVGERRLAERAAQAPQQRARPVGWQIEHRQVGQLLAPIGELPLELGREGGVALPDRIIPIADRQRRQRRRRVPAYSVIEQRQLASEHADRPLVAGDVVQHHRQQIRFCAGTIERRADHRPLRQIERLPGLHLGRAHCGISPSTWQSTTASAVSGPRPAPPGPAGHPRGGSWFGESRAAGSASRTPGRARPPREAPVILSAKAML